MRRPEKFGRSIRAFFDAPGIGMTAGEPHWMGSAGFCVSTRQLRQRAKGCVPGVCCARLFALARSYGGGHEHGEPAERQLSCQAPCLWPGNHIPRGALRMSKTVIGRT